MLDDKMLSAPSAPITSTPHISAGKAPVLYLRDVFWGETNLKVVKGKVPIHEEEDDEEELRKLRAEMAIAS